jgi:VWFA-related protein
VRHHRFASIGSLILVATGLVHTQDPAAPPGGQQPVFRTGVNLVRVDVIVTDEDDKPVTDLRKEEFEIVEDGQRQTIDLFRQVRIDSSTADASRPRQVLSRDTEEAEASRDDVRIFGILLADYQVCAERSRLVREALASFINKLGPNDLVAVMTPLMSVRDLVFTYDHESILRTIQRFEGRRGDYIPRNAVEEEHTKVGAVERLRNAVVRDALRAAAVRLGSMREGRKSLLFVSEGFPPGWFNDPRQLRDITQEANRQNTSIYALDPRGLATGDAASVASNRPGCGRVPTGMARRLAQDTLRELADETDGRAIVERNTLNEGLEQILRDSSLYYLLGYSSTAAQADGKFHRIRVRVNRPKTEVRARKGYWASTAEDVSRAANPAPVTPRPVLDALAVVAAPNQDGRLMLTWMGISRGADGMGRVTVVWEPIAAASSARGEGARVTITATRPRAETVFESSPAEMAGTSPQRVSFDAGAGALEVRITVADREGGTIDRETRVVDVPDYAKPVASLGTLKFYRARTAREFQTFATDADAIPIAVREFARTDRLLIRFDVYGPEGPTSSTGAAILNRAGRKMFDVPVGPATAGASHQIDLTLSPLPVGEYVLEVATVPDGPKQLAAFRIR